MSNNYRIPQRNFDTVEAEISRLNKRAAKLGVGSIILNIQGYETVTKLHKPTGIEYQQIYVLVELQGVSPKLAGWTLVAAVERLESGENQVRSVPGQECPTFFRNANVSCDHCGTSRRRKEIFVLRHESGEYKQVGRQCIADFLGGKTPEAILGAAEMLWAAEACCGEADDFEYCGGGRGDRSTNTELFLSATAICIRKLGWVSKKVAEDRAIASTGSDVLRLLYQHDKYTTEWIKENELVIQDRDCELAAKALAWGKSLPVDGDDYLYNLGVACRNVAVFPKSVGIMASLLSAYGREMDRQAGIEAKRVENAKIERKHVGQPGKRETFTLTVKGMRQFPGDYGVKTLVRFEDADRNIYTWWASGDPAWLEEGQTYAVVGTVKKHEDYKGIPQTVLQRVSKAKAAA